MSLEHLVIPEQKKYLKERGKKVEGCQKGMGADLKACNSQSWNNLSKNINNDSIGFLPKE